MTGLLNLLLTLGVFSGVLLALLAASPVLRTMLGEIIFHPFVASHIEIDDSQVSVVRGEIKETPQQRPAVSAHDEAMRTQ
jgi:hypothetical protein